MGCYFIKTIFVDYWEMNILTPSKTVNLPLINKVENRAFVTVRHNVMLSIQTLFISGESFRGTE